MFCLKLSDYCDKKAVIGRDAPAEVGQHCSEPTSFPTLRLMLNHPLCPYLTHSALKGWLYMHELNGFKNILYPA